MKKKSAQELIDPGVIVALENAIHLRLAYCSWFMVQGPHLAVNNDSHLYFARILQQVLAILKQDSESKNIQPTRSKAKEEGQASGNTYCSLEIEDTLDESEWSAAPACNTLPTGARNMQWSREKDEQDLAIFSMLKDFNSMRGVLYQVSTDYKERKIDIFQLTLTMNLAFCLAERIEQDFYAAHPGFINFLAIFDRLSEIMSQVDAGMNEDLEKRDWTTFPAHQVLTSLCQGYNLSPVQPIAMYLHCARKLSNNNARFDRLTKGLKWLQSLERGTEPRQSTSLPPVWLAFALTVLCDTLVILDTSISNGRDDLLYLVDQVSGSHLAWEKHIRAFSQPGGKFVPHLSFHREGLMSRWIEGYGRGIGTTDWQLALITNPMLAGAVAFDMVMYIRG